MSSPITSLPFSVTSVTLDDSSAQYQVPYNNDVITTTPIIAKKSNDIFSLARAFLSIASMTDKKLQKLCYYAKAWYLALYDKNLISDQFHAWVHWSVQPAFYQKYKAYGYEEIPQITNTDDIHEEFLSFAHDVYESYGHLSGYDLECLNHQEDPWINARGDCKPWERCTNEISEEDMKTYYRKMIK